MRRAFTLIEVMICIALLAIVMATATMSWLGLAQLRREADFRFALRNARHQLAVLENAPYASLPPQVLRPDRQGWLQLGQTEVVGDTLRLTRLDAHRRAVPVRALQAAQGRVQVDPGLAGVQLMADYEWLLPDRHEAQLVDATGRVELWNAPAVRVVSVELAQGPRLVPLRDWQLRADRVSLQLPRRLAGRPVVVGYLGTRVRNRARGSFLNEKLEGLDSPSPLKLMEILEDYGQQVGTLRLTTLRVNR